jgi:uncharacterized protein YecT (DUF1311 family)
VFRLVSLACLLLLASSVRASARAAEPSFDCKTATTPTDQLICSDHMLASFDQQLDTAFRNRHRTADGSSQVHIVTDERTWRQGLLTTCHKYLRSGEIDESDRPLAIWCFREEYTRRIIELTSNFDFHALFGLTARAAPRI